MKYIQDRGEVKKYILMIQDITLKKDLMRVYNGTNFTMREMIANGVFETTIISVIFLHLRVMMKLNDNNQHEDMTDALREHLFDYAIISKRAERI